eukprot:TRINITY_DN500_c0_g1_i1.p1 TRINITY_DN500_c0_g1~~TRINITY_DN500_c0_g1_i1.p1  ORF type:complete len:157 (-),score=47.84 TRINITY_DN500_c0_g1_i1:172-606(-)
MFLATLATKTFQPLRNPVFNTKPNLQNKNVQNFRSIQNLVQPKRSIFVMKEHRPKEKADHGHHNTHDHSHHHEAQEEGLNTWRFGKPPTSKGPMPLYLLVTIAAFALCFELAVEQYLQITENGPRAEARWLITERRKNSTPTQE